jgi:hypothetical protein
VRTSLLVVIGLVGCVQNTPDGPRVIGSPNDVATAPGTYDGYRVVMPCPQPGTSLGVDGTGTTVLAKVADIEAAGETLLAQFHDLPSVFGGAGYGLVCEPGVGTSLMLDDWRDVDTVIARTGTWLHDQNLSLQVGVMVSSIPVPDLGQ